MFLHGLVAVSVEIVRFERNIHLFDCNTSWVYLDIVSLYKPVSLSKIKVLYCVNDNELCYVTHNVTVGRRAANCLFAEKLSNSLRY